LIVGVVDGGNPAVTGPAAVSVGLRGHVKLQKGLSDINYARFLEVADAQDVDVQPHTSMLKLKLRLKTVLMLMAMRFSSIRT
jgi:hypothetical protein